MDFASIDRSTARLPSRYNAAKAALRTCTAVDECKDWVDKTSAMASYAKQAGDKLLEHLAEACRDDTSPPRPTRQVLPPVQREP
jgi:hypothetical protein